MPIFEPMARFARPWSYLTVLVAAFALLAAPARAAPGNGPRVRELAGAAVHPWRLEIHRAPDPKPEAEPKGPGGQLALPRILPLPGLPVAASAEPGTAGSPVAPETSERTFAELQALGVRNARVDLLWCQIEPSAPAQGDVQGSSAPDWTVFDSVVASAERYGIALTPVVLCVPGWANGGAHYLTYPTDMTAFERFFAAALLRYPQIQAWEIWNEPNNEYFARPQPRVEPFVALLRAAHRARASTGSQAKLISGGLAAGGGIGMFTFFEQMADSGALDLIDGLGIHPYSTRAPDEARSTFMRLAELRRRLVARSRSHISLWLTEYGVPDSTRRSGYGEAGGQRATSRPSAARLRDRLALAVGRPPHVVRSPRQLRRSGKPRVPPRPHASGLRRQGRRVCAAQPARWRALPAPDQHDNRAGIERTPPGRADARAGPGPGLQSQWNRLCARRRLGEPEGCDPRTPAASARGAEPAAHADRYFASWRLLGRARNIAARPVPGASGLPRERAAFWFQWGARIPGAGLSADVVLTHDP